MKYTVKPTSKFQKHLKRIQKRGYDIGLLTDIIKKLANGETLPQKNRDHSLSGNYSNCRECYIAPDWFIEIVSPASKKMDYKYHTQENDDYVIPDT